MREGSVVHLDGIQPEQLVLTALRVGQRFPTHCTALGKVLLGSADAAIRDECARNLRARGAIQRTPSTVLDPQKLIEQLVSVSVQGYAIDVEEYEIGLRCVAAPVFDASGGIVGALSVSGPSIRMPEDAMHGVIKRAVTAAADQLSQELGRLP